MLDHVYTLVWSFSGQEQAEAGEGHKETTFDHRKKMRQERKLQMQALIDEKPREDAADPRDIESIAYAESHMGDYKLKSSPSYEVRVLVVAGGGSAKPGPHSTASP